jgi:UTP--glucose-1-phosphate uridylyltransferase
VNKLSKVIIPAAGLGTRMLPATKAIPKEMLPILDKPIIQYVVEECITAGFKEIILVTHSSKNSLENHFDTSFELESTLEKRIKKSLLKEIKSISNLKAKIISIRQGEAIGLGHAILQAKDVIGNEPFAVVLPDRVMNPYASDLKRENLSFMRKSFNESGESIILLEKINRKDVSKFGIAKLESNFKGSESAVNLVDIIEKPSINKAPSNYAAVGRYIFNPDIFSYISDKKDKKKEIELTDGIKEFLKSDNVVKATLLSGECFDCGNKEGYLRSIISFASNHPDLKKSLKKIIKSY